MARIHFFILVDSWTNITKISARTAVLRIRFFLRIKFFLKLNFQILSIRVVWVYTIHSAIFDNLYFAKIPKLPD